MILRKLELDKVSLKHPVASKHLNYNDYNVEMNITSVVVPIIISSVSWFLQMMSPDKHTSDSDSAANGDVTREICENGMDINDELL